LVFDQTCTTLLILLTSVCTEKYMTSVFLYKPRPAGSVCTEKTNKKQYFSEQTSRSVNKKLLIHNMLCVYVYIIICIVRIEKTNKKQYFSVQISRSVNNHGY
jgi:hypothetical protein